MRSHHPLSACSLRAKKWRSLHQKLPLIPSALLPCFPPITPRFRSEVCACIFSRGTERILLSYFDTMTIFFLCKANDCITWVEATEWRINPSVLRDAPNYYINYSYAYAVITTKGCYLYSLINVELSSWQNWGKIICICFIVNNLENVFDD